MADTIVSKREYSYLGVTEECNKVFFSSRDCYTMNWSGDYLTEEETKRLYEVLKERYEKESS